MLSKKVWIGAGVGVVVVAAGVVVGLSMLHADDWKEDARTRVGEVLALRDDIAEYLKNADALEGEALKKYQAKGEQIAVLKEKIGELTDMEKVCEMEFSCEDVKAAVEDLVKLHDASSMMLKWNTAENGATAEEIEKLENSDFAGVAAFAGDMASLREKLAEFDAAYPEEKYLNDLERIEMITKYGEIEIFAEDLKSRYENYGFKDLFGRKEDDFLKFFDNIKKLQEDLN